MQFGTMFQIDTSPRITTNELARRVHMTPQSMSSLLEKLEHLQYITRTKSAKGKVRRNLLTVLGKKSY